MKKLFTIIVALFVVASIFAQVPQNFNYQAIVRGSDGSLITNQTVGVKITVLNYRIIGKPTTAYSETHSVTTNENGLISLQIGSGTAVSGTFSDVDFSLSGTTKNYSIKSEIDPEGGTNYTITGEKTLSSVPYAKVAETTISLAHKSIPMNIYGAFLGGSASFESGGSYSCGILLPTPGSTIGSSKFIMSFVIPNDYIPGDEILLNFTVVANGTGEVKLLPNFLSIARVEGGYITGSYASSGLTINTLTVNLANTPYALQGKITCPDSNTTLQPGDVISFSYFRSSSDTSNPNYKIQGLEITY